MANKFRFLFRYIFCSSHGKFIGKMLKSFVLFFCVILEKYLFDLIMGEIENFISMNLGFWNVSMFLSLETP